MKQPFIEAITTQPRKSSMPTNELAMQKGQTSINLPKNQNDILPIHADTWNGVSP